MSSESSESVAIVRLYLVVEEDSAFYLEIPLDHIRALCSSPRKYLVYLGWCILGVVGSLSLRDKKGKYHRIPSIGDLVQGERYYLIVSNQARFAVVDLEVIKTRTGVLSETTGSRTQFRTQFRTELLQRDARCVWTGRGERYCKAVHIIPYRRGSDWLSLIVENRPSNSQEDEGLEDIIDVRNGFIAFSPIHVAFESRELVILKTPNRILDSDDVPARDNREIYDDVKYPRDRRYTLQWLAPDAEMEAIIPNNSDATFRKRTRMKKPSELLLDYNYGAAAVKLWGHGKEVLRDLTEPPRPPSPVPPLAGPSKTKADRKITIKKREKAKQREEKAKKGKAKKGKSKTRNAAAGEESHEAAWDEDDVMLFFWGNSRAAQERHSKRSEDKRKDMEQWRQGIRYTV